MGKEKALLSFIAVFIGLLVAGIAFYFYENSKAIPPSEDVKTLSAAASPSPTPQPSMFLNLDLPYDEEVVQKKIITISGKTVKDATVIILTANTEAIVSPTSNGEFSSTLTIENGQNFIEVTAITPNKEKVKVIRTVTFSTEEF